MRLRLTWLFIFGAINGLLCATPAEELEYQSLEEAQAAFANKPLCFIGVLEAYTDLEQTPVDLDKRIARGMKFRVLSGPQPNTPKNYWMHICFEPRQGEIFGPAQKTYAVTLLKGAVPGGTAVQSWPICADALTFTPIIILNKPPAKGESSP